MSPRDVHLIHNYKAFLHFNLKKFAFLSVLYLDYYNMKITSLIICYMMTDGSQKNMLICMEKSSKYWRLFEDNLPNGKFTFV